MKLFLQKNAKFLSAGGSAPRPPCLRRLGALSPNPQPTAAGGFVPQTPIGLRRLGAPPPDPPNSPPIANFWLRACKKVQQKYQKSRTSAQCKSGPEKNFSGPLQVFNFGPTPARTPRSVCQQTIPIQPHMPFKRRLKTKLTESGIIFKVEAIVLQ